MKCPTLCLDLDPNSAQPLFLTIARALAEEIRSGKLPGNTQLPGSRKLAASLGVHRNTVLAALAELEQEGWIRTKARSGTFVESSFPHSVGAAVPTRRSVATSSGPIDWQLGAVSLPPCSPAPTPGVLALVGGLPDMRLVPFRELTRAYRRAVLASEHSLDYASAWGHPRLRLALTQLLEQARGMRVQSSQVLVTRGSQMALYLAGQALSRQGACIAVENLGYPPAWQALRMGGARLEGVGVDGQGIDTERLGQLCQTTKLSAVYVTPHHQYPTTVTLSARRRERLLSLARRYRFVILEDDYDHEQHYAGRPVLPLAAQDRDVVLYIGTFSKVLAPGLRVGYAVGPTQLVERMMQLRTYIDRQGDSALEAALAELIEDGALQRHTRRVTKHSLQRRDALVSALERHLGTQLRFRIPPGGMALWAKARTSTAAWARRALQSGVMVHPGRAYRLDGGASDCLRLGFGRLTPAEIEVAVQRLAACHRPSSGE